MTDRVLVPTAVGDLQQVLLVAVADEAAKP